MDWLLLVLAGLLEIVGVIGIKKVAENDNWKNNLLMILGYILSFQLLQKAMQTIPLSTAYVVWTGIGTIGATVVGVVLYKESKSLLRFIFIFGIIFSIIGLKISG